MQCLRHFTKAYELSKLLILFGLFVITPIKLLTQSFSFTGFSLLVVDWREREPQGSAISSNASCAPAIASHLEMAGDANRGQRTYVRNTVNFQCIAGVPRLLADLFHHGRAVLRRKVFQMLRWVRRTFERVDCEHAMGLYQNELHMGEFKNKLRPRRNGILGAVPGRYIRRMDGGHGWCRWQSWRKLAAGTRGQSLRLHLLRYFHHMRLVLHPQSVHRSHHW